MSKTLPANSYKKLKSVIKKNKKSTFKVLLIINYMTFTIKRHVYTTIVSMLILPRFT